MNAERVRMWLLVFGVLCAANLCPWVKARAAVPPSPSSLQPEWLDSEGNYIQAHGGGILFHEGGYYWYGEDKNGPTKPGGCGARVDVRGVSCYYSTDLVHWSHRGLVLKAVEDDPAHDLHPSKIVERPKVIYNARTRKFVMWMHIDSWNYSAARAGVAVSDSPAGPFHYIKSFDPNGQQSRDMALFQDDDGKAYLIHSSENNATLHIDRLDDDYLKPTGEYSRAFVKRSMEAPAFFKRDGKYYMIASGCTGWSPNAARSAVAASIMGPWTELKNPCRGEGSEKSFGSQSTFVLPLRGGQGSYLLMADRWNIQDLGRSGYLWLPIEFEGDQPVITNPHAF